MAHPAAAELLRLCAFLHPEGIPEKVITQGTSALGELLGPAASDPVTWVKIRSAACRYALLGRDPATRTLTLHRVIQAVLRDQMDKGTQRCWAKRAVRALAQGFPTPEFTNWPQCDRWLPHALVGAAWIEQWDFSLAEAAFLLNEVGFYLHERGRYFEAEPLLQRALAIRKKVLSPNHPGTAESLNDLVGLYRAKGRYAKARPLYQRALAIREQILGAEHPNTAASLHSLARLYHDQGHYTGAEPLYWQALTISEHVLGPEHPQAALTLSNLALLYYAQGTMPRPSPCINGP